MLDLLTSMSKDVVLPIAIALVIYLVADRLTDFKKRRNASELGVAIIESLREEIRTGIANMADTLDKSGQEIANPPSSYLPVASWSGMVTIPDEVFLSIISLSKTIPSKPFHPRTIRIHCKNYFEHMCANYNHAVDQLPFLASHGQDWRPLFQGYLDDNRGQYIKSAQNVFQMLYEIMGLLEANAKSWFPK